MFIFLIVLILIVTVLLILAVLMQNSKKEGLGNAYLGGTTGASQLIGVKKTSDLLEQITWGLVTSLFVLSLISSFFINRTNRSGISSSSPNINRVQEQNALPDTVTPDLPKSPSDTTTVTD